jgi:hypothetical protein
MKIRISDSTFLSCFFLLITVAILASAYHMLIREDYDIIVEAPCDATRDICFARDCSLEECPLNGLEQYRILSIAAREYPECAADACLEKCLDGSIACTEIVCGDTEEDVCAQ